MRSFKYTLSIFTLLFIVSCAKEETAVTNETGPIYKGPFYNEFLACNAGPKFEDDIQEMDEKDLKAYNKKNVLEING